MTITLQRFQWFAIVVNLGMAGVCLFTTWRANRRFKKALAELDGMRNTYVQLIEQTTAAEARRRDR